MPSLHRADGFDRSKILWGSAAPSSNDLFWFYSNKPLPGKKENIAPVLAMRSGDWKFLMEEDGSNRQLYNLKHDHRETKNVANREKEVTKRLQKKLADWHQQVVKFN